MWMCKKCETYNEDSNQKCLICFAAKNEFDDLQSEDAAYKRNISETEIKLSGTVPLNMKTYDTTSELTSSDLQIFSDVNDFDISTTDTRFPVTSSRKSFVDKLKNHKKKLIFLAIAAFIAIIIYLMSAESKVIFDYIKEKIYYE